MLEVPLGIFYRQTDYSKPVEGGYQTVGLRFLGEDVTGRDILLIDDMIVTGNSMIRTARDLKKRGAKRIFCASAFAQLLEPSYRPTITSTPLSFRFSACA